MRFHLDTDVGGDIDDLCALGMLLKSPDVEITGITTVSEDEGRRAGHASYVLSLVGRDEVPVAAGADIKLGRFRHEKYDYPDEERYWPQPLKRRPGSLETAVNLLKDSIEAGAIIIAIGPFSNLFLLEKRYPGILRQTKVFLMGGHVNEARLGFPSWDYHEDYNVQEDTEAAEYVLESAGPALTIVPIEVTAETALTRSHLPHLMQGDRLSQLIATQAEAFAQDNHYELLYGQTCSGLPPDIINFLHDPLACFFLIPAATISAIVLFPSRRLIYPSPSRRPHCGFAFQVRDLHHNRRFLSVLNASRGGLYGECKSFWNGHSHAMQYWVDSYPL